MCKGSRASTCCFSGRATIRGVNRRALSGWAAIGVACFGTFLSAPSPADAQVPQPFLVRDIITGAAGAASSDPRLLGEVNELLLLEACSQDAASPTGRRCALWRSDGATDGTEIVSGFRGPDAVAPFVGYTTTIDGVLHFVARGDNNTWALWRSDGTTSGTVVVHTRLQSNSTPVATLGPVAAIGPALIYRACEVDDDHVPVDCELWRTTPTQGATAVRDINPGLASSDPNQFTEFEGLLYFRACDHTDAFDRATNCELWRTDGTTDGTTLVYDLPNGSLEPAFLTVLGNRLYFQGFSPDAGTELWSTDGTAAGTYMVLDINPGPGNGFAGNSYHPLTRFGTNLIFFADNGVDGTELWVSDGSPGGTHQLKDIAVGDGSSIPQIAQVALAGGVLYFYVGDGPPSSSGAPSDVQLWRTDGTTNGTFRFFGGIPGEPSVTFNVAAAGDHLFFSGCQTEPTGNGCEPWQSDGTVAGTRLVGDINPGVPSSNPSGFLEARGLVLFSADRQDTGTELWALPTVTGAADVSVTKDNGTASLIPGQTTTYEIRVTNHGSATLATLNLDDIDARGLLLDPVFVPSAGSYNAIGRFWVDLNLEPEETVSLFVTGRVPATATGQFANRVVVSPSVGVEDPLLADNTAIDVDALTPQADIRLVKTVSLPV